MGRRRPSTANAAVPVLRRVPATAPRLPLLWARWLAAQGARARWPGLGRPRRAKQCCRPCGSLRRRPPATGLLLAGETAPGPRQKVQAWPEQRCLLHAVAHPAAAASSSSNLPGAGRDPAPASARQVHHGCTRTRTGLGRRGSFFRTCRGHAGRYGPKNWSEWARKSMREVTECDVDERHRCGGGRSPGPGSAAPSWRVMARCSRELRRPHGLAASCRSSDASQDCRRGLTPSGQPLAIVGKRFPKNGDSPRSRLTPWSPVLGTPDTHQEA